MSEVFGQRSDPPNYPRIVLERVSRLTLVLAVLAAVLSGLGTTTQADDSTFAPYFEDPTAAELTLYDEAVPCPPLFDWENTARTVDVDSNVSIRCSYRNVEGNTQFVTVRWMKADNPFYATSFCESEAERDDTGTGLISNKFYDGTGHAVWGEYRLNDADDAEETVQASAGAMVAAAIGYARGCAEQPTMLDCPEVPGFTLRPGSEPATIRPDSFSQSCGYEGTNPAAFSDFRTEVWWAARLGNPELLSRLCNEFPMEGVGFGSLIADGVAANATYKLDSPLEGPDRAVAIAATQGLLDQAAAVARSCDQAEVNPTTFLPFPQHLASAFTPELTDSPTTGGGMASLPEGGISSLPSGPGRGSSDDGFIQTLIRIGSVVMFGFSILGLFITFLLVRRETRIREKRDMLRIGITLGVAVLSVLIIGRDAPMWAILVAVGLGVALGTWQGNSLMVRNTERGLVGKRSLIAIVAFSAGVLLMQAAGFLNRSGGVTLGIAVSFLSAAITTGLFIGRKPRMVEALSGAARALLPLLLVAGLLGGFGASIGNAQTEQPATPALPAGTCRPTGGLFGFLTLDGCEGYQYLLDLVPWDTAFVSGGLWWSDGKPPAPISLPRAMTTPPDPVTQTVSWSTTDSSDNQVVYDVTETYSFGTLAEGLCCTAFYEATGTKTTTRVSNGEVVVDTTEVSGRLEDVQPFGTIAIGGEPIGVPFSEVLTLNGFPEDSCQRAVAWRQEDNEEGAATWDSIRVNGEEAGHASTQVTVFIDCDLPDFTYENAFALAPSIPASNDPVRHEGGRVDGNPETCPVRQEFARSVWAAGQFEGVDTLTLAELYLEPNATQCSYGSLFSMVSFGQGGRGGTRHQIMYRLAILNDPEDEAARVAEDAYTFYNTKRLTSLPEHERCELGGGGVPLQPADGSACRYISLHSVDESGGLSGLRQTGRSLQTRNVGGGVVYIETDWDTSDGPNVTVRAHLPWGKYVYRCHHCTPGSQSVHDFIRSLHGFGVSRGQFDPAFDEGETAVTSDSTTTTTEANPRFTEETEFIPIEEEEGITDEEAALIGLIGLLGSMGLLGASLEGTGLTPADIAEAVRRGDLTGGVDAPPELLDEDDNPLTVNDGSFPEAPVGHVWWGTGGDEGRWVSPEDARDLVTAERASDAALEQDAQARINAIFGPEGHADRDFGTLIRTTRAQTAEAEMAAAVAGEERRVLDEGTQEAWEAALDSGNTDLVDFLDNNSGLTAEQIQAVFDAINRRGEDQAALDAIPEVNVWRETAEGSLETMAELAEAGGRPDIAWILRNPGVSVRVGAAVASGGASEFVAIPIQITSELHEAQERSIRENGRMMSSNELMGELGWALGREAVFEAGGRLAAHGIGSMLSSTDELAEAGIRQLDEATEEVSEAVSREASELVESGGKQLDEAAGGAGTAGGQLDEAGEQLVRSTDEAAGGAGTAGGQLDEAGEELIGVPPKGNETIRDLPTGARIDDELIPETGLGRNQIDELQDYTRQNDLNVTGRATNPHSAAPLADGSAVAKPLDIKIKTGTDVDVLLGADPSNRGLVTLFEPEMPNTTGMSDDLIQVLERRHTQRMAEWNRYGETWSRGHRVTSFGGVERTQRFIDGRIEVLYDGQWRSVAGDFDLVNITRADGSPLSATEFQRHVDELVERGLVEHGGEVRVMTDVMRNNPHPPMSDEWMEAARETWQLREGLEAAHPDEVVIGIHATEGLHRGPRIDHLEWQGGFEAPGGGLIEF